MTERTVTDPACVSCGHREVEHSHRFAIAPRPQGTGWCGAEGCSCPKYVAPTVTERPDGRAPDTPPVQQPDCDDLGRGHHVWLKRDPQPEDRCRCGSLTWAQGSKWAAPDTPPDYEALARRFHEAYERLAPEFSYETRKASAVPWEDVPENNRRLMIATVRAAFGATPDTPPDAPTEGGDE